MPALRVNGVRLHCETAGSGPGLVLVHGSWGDHRNWDAVAPQLARSFRVARYDRRGHSRSEAPPGPGSVRDDVHDLLGIIEELGLAPAVGVGNSFGAGIVLRAAAERPGAFRGIVVHEPPLVGLLRGDAAMAPLLQATRQRFDAVLAELAKDREAGTKLFVESVAFGPGAWATLPAGTRATFVRNAGTWEDEMRDPDALTMDVAGLERFDRPALLSQGDESPPFFAAVLDVVAARMPRARRVTMRTGHAPHVTHPGAWLQQVRAFAEQLP